MTQECKGCKAELTEGFKFCPACGYPVAEGDPVKEEEIEEVCKDLVKVEATDREKERATGGFWDKIKKVGRDIPFIKEAVALYYMLTDDSLSMLKRSAAIFAIIYFITPLDLVSDYIPLVGLLDDAAVIMWVIEYYRGTMRPYFKKADEWLKEEKAE
jgi:uncharacterized membrane protein YkvA (DUF1232 family)